MKQRIWTALVAVPAALASLAAEPPEGAADAGATCPCPAGQHCTILGTQRIGDETATICERVTEASQAGSPSEIVWQRSGPGHAFQERQLYAGPCERADESSDPWATVCRLGPNRLEIHRGSKYAEWGRVFQLSPLELVSEQFGSWEGAGGVIPPWPHFRATWDWQAGRGGGELIEISPRRCGSSKEDTPTVQKRFWYLPEIATPPELLHDGWKTTPLGSCALDLGANDTPGFLLAGARERGASVKLVLLSQTELLAEVPAPSGPPSSTWRNDDHLELWHGVVKSQAAQDLTGLDAEQWAIRVADGKVFRAFGKPASVPAVERAERKSASGEKVVVLKIRLPFKAQAGTALAVVYARGDGKKVQSSIGTSELCVGVGETLGLAMPVSAELASCSARDGRLDYAPIDLSSGKGSLDPAARK